MKLLDYCDTINVNIEMRYYHNQDKRFMAHFESTEVRTGAAGLLGEFGGGHTPEEAMKDYIEKIKGKKIIVCAMSKELRREFVVPDSLEY